MSDGAKTMAAALVKFQASLEPARKDATNPHLRNKYASLAAVWEALAGPLEKAGLAVLQPASTKEGKAVVRTILLHESGEKMEFDPIEMPADKATAQAMGSAITYARRYALSSLLGVVADDDDGNAASGRHAHPSPPRPPPAPPSAALREKLSNAIKPKPPAEMTPLEKMLAHGKEHGLSDTQTKQAIKSALGKGTVNPAELTDADVFTVAKHMQTEREASAS